MKLPYVYKPILTIAMIAGALPAAAHHSFAMFDKSKEKSVAGVVERLAWTNPHVMIDIEVPNKQSRNTRYRIESASVNILMRQGWKVGAIKPGDRVTIVFNPLRNGQAGGLLVKVIRADRSELKG
jgi:hypothetical protein